MTAANGAQTEGDAPPRIVRGHALRGYQANVYGNKRFVCECGETGFPADTCEVAHEFPTAEVVA